MSSPSRVVRLFVSSTFRDMRAERDQLITVVFPELAERLERLGLEFYDVDLRWGVPERTAGGDRANSWEYCKKWIDRCRPFFLGILGQRYGWVPPPEEIHDPEDRRRWAGLSITEMELRHAILDGKGPSRHAAVYLRESRVPDPPDIDAATYESFVDRRFEDRQERLREELRRAALGGGGRVVVRPYHCEWSGDGFGGMEGFGRAVLEDLWSAVLRDPEYVSESVWAEVLGHGPGDDPIYTDRTRPIPADVWELLVVRASPSPADPTDDEARRIDAFMADRTRWFHGRHEALAELAAFAGSGATDGRRTLVLRAPPGQGKTALLARFAGAAAAQGHLVLPVFVGATESSTDAQGVVRSLNARLDRAGVAPAEGGEARSPDAAFRRFTSRLESHDDSPRVILVLDGVNQLGPGRDLAWLPARVGAGVRVIVSTIEPEAGGAAEREVAAALGGRQPEPIWSDLRPLDPGAVRAVAIDFLNEYCKELDAEHVDAIARTPQAANPLYLMVMLAELRSLGGHDLNRTVPELIARMAARHPDAVSLFEWVLEGLEVFGRDAVRSWCLLLALGRVGLSVREMRELSALRTCGGEVPPTRDEMALLLAGEPAREAAAVAERIRRSLRRYLQRRGPRFDYFHGQLRAAALRKYADSTGDVADWNGRLADYFALLADPRGDGTFDDADPRGLNELPHHRLASGRAAECERTVCDLRFVRARCRAGQVHELRTDYDAARRARPDAATTSPFDRVRPATVPGWLGAVTASIASRASEVHPDSGAGPALALMRSGPQSGRPSVPDRPEFDEGDPLPAEFVGRDRSSLPGGLPAESRAEDRLGAFADFVTEHADRLRHFPDEAVVMAYNATAAGEVAEAAARIIEVEDRPWLRREDRPGRSASRGPIVQTLPADTGTPMGCTVAVTPDGRLALALDTDKSLRVWDLASGRPGHPLIGHFDGIKSVALSDDGRRAVTGALDRHFRVWDVGTGQCALARQVERAVVAVAISADGRIGAVGLTPVDGLAMSEIGLSALSKTAFPCRFVNLEDGTTVSEAPGHAGGVYGLSLTPDARLAASIGHLEGAARVWDVRTGRALCEFRPEGRRPTSVHLSDDGTLLAVGTDKATAELIHVPTGRHLRRFAHGEAGMVFSVQISRDGRSLVTSRGLGSIQVWELATGRCRTSIAHTHAVYAVRLTADATLAVSDGADRTLRVWDLTAEGTGDGSTARVRELAAGEELDWVGTEDGRLTPTRRDGSDPGVPAVSPSGGPGDRQRPAAYPGPHSVVTCGDRGLSMWDATTGRLWETPTEHNREVDAIAVSPGGRLIAGACRDARVRVWDASDGRPLLTLPGLNAGSVMGHLSVFAQMAVEEWAKAKISIAIGYPLDVEADLSDDPRFRDGHWAAVKAVAFSPCGRLLVTAGNDRTVRVWDLEHRSLRRTWAGPIGPVNGLAVTPDGRQVIACGRDDPDLWVWALDGGPHSRLRGHRVGVHAVAVSADGELFVSGGADGTVRVWERASGREMAVYATASGVRGDAPPDTRGQALGWDSGVVAVTPIDAHGRLACLDDAGRVHRLTFRRHPFGRPAVTARRRFHSGGPDVGTFAESFSVRCPWCGRYLRAPGASDSPREITCRGCSGRSRLEPKAADDAAVLARLTEARQPEPDPRGEQPEVRVAREMFLGDGSRSPLLNLPRRMLVGLTDTLARQADLYLQQGQLNEALRLFALAHGMGVESGDLEMAGSGLIGQARVYDRAGQFEKSLELSLAAEQALHSARPDRFAFALVFSAILLMQLKRYEEAMERLDRQIAFCRTHGLNEQLAKSLRVRGSLCQDVLGRPEEGFRCAEEAYRISVEHRLGVLADARKDYQAALSRRIESAGTTPDAATVEAARRSETLARETGEQRPLCLALRVRLDAAMAANDADAARVALAELGPELATWLAELGGSPRKELPPFLAALIGIGERLQAAAPDGELARATAGLKELTDRHSPMLDEALGLARRVSEAAETLGEPARLRFAESLIREAEAKILLGDGDRERGRAALDEAHRHAEEHGLTERVVHIEGLASAWAG